MSLPTELRLMIFRYLFPKTISAEGHPDSHAAVLSTNRQLYQEASAVLYEETHFYADVDHQGISMQGMVWSREPYVKSENKDFSVAASLPQASAQRMKNLNVGITIGNHFRRASVQIRTRGITVEDYLLYATRDTVRRLANMICSKVEDPSTSPNYALKRLKVTITISQDNSWTVSDAIAAIGLAIDNFKLLHGIESPVLEIKSSKLSPPNAAVKDKFIDAILSKKSYQSLRRDWTTSLGDLNSRGLTPKKPEITAAYEKIEHFAQLIHYHEAISERPWPARVFQGLDRPLHFARVAYENHDAEALQTIREAIKVRWVNSQRQQQQSLQVIADRLDTMFDDNIDSNVEDAHQKPSELYPDAFKFGNEKSLPQEQKSCQFWTEIDDKDWAPDVRLDDVTHKVKGIRVRIMLHGRVWKRLKTPALARQIAQIIERKKKAQQAEAVVKTEQT
ncbi:hypothetical protein NX059_003703 [Plenodomus lindquistii]|nr:hypothetical protein NX059_003703 [Plenodomus lindquistii]